MYLRWGLLLLFLLSLVVFNLAQPTKDTAGTNRDASTLALDLHRALFNAKRQEHRAAVKDIQRQGSKDKREKLILAMLDGMKKTFEQSRVDIERAGFIPGMPFPAQKKDGLKEALSKILENAAFFADLALYFSDIVTKEYKANNDLKTLANWAIMFSNTSQFYDEQATHLMHLVGQELGLVQKEPNYTNPYAPTARIRPASVEDMYQAKKGKEKKKKKKGPHMQQGSKVEL